MPTDEQVKANREWLDRQAELDNVPVASFVRAHLAAARGLDNPFLNSEGKFRVILVDPENHRVLPSMAFPDLKSAQNFAKRTDKLFPDKRTSYHVFNQDTGEVHTAG